MTKAGNGRHSPEEKARYAFLHEIGVCAASGREGEIHAAHIRAPDFIFGKADTGAARKPHWVWTLPLLPAVHENQHSLGEQRFWEGVGMPLRSLTGGPLATALILEGFRTLGDVEAARRWLRARREMPL